MSPEALLHKFGKDRLSHFRGRLLLYQWLEDSLTAGEKANEDLYVLKTDSEEIEEPIKYVPAISGSEDQPSTPKRTRYSPDVGLKSQSYTQGSPDSPTTCSVPSTSASPGEGIEETPTSPQSKSTSVYKPPDLNRNITEIYRALGDDRRSFSYYKAIPVIEKFPTKIETVDQLKHLPGIGKSLREIIFKRS